MKPEQWGSPLVQEKYQEEKACDKRHPYRIIIIMIIIIIIIITTTTCLTTMYKTLTGIIAKRISTYIWKSRDYYEQSKKDVTLEVKVATIS